MTDQRGFAVTELMTVSAIISIIVSMAVPNLIESRKSANEAAAISALRTISTAQLEYYRATGDYASNLEDLAAERLVPEDLGGGTKQGYSFRIVFVSVPDNTPHQFYADAEPTSRGRTGDRSFYVDETGIIRATGDGCPYGFDPVVINGEIVCIADPQEQGKPHVIEGNIALEALSSLSLLGDGSVIPGAMALLSEDSSRFTRMLDANNDGAVTFDEALSADIMNVVFGSDRARLAESAQVGAIVARMQTRLRADLDFHASETILPAVQLSALSGYPVEFLELVPPSAPYAAFVVILERLGAQSPSARIQNLIGRVEQAQQLVRSGDVSRAIRELLLVRERANSWIAGDEAQQVQAHLDALIGLLSGRTSTP